MTSTTTATTATTPTTTTTAPKSMLRPVIAAVLSTVVVHLAALIALVVSAATLFQSRRFVTDVIIHHFSRLVLWFLGVRVVVHDDTGTRAASEAKGIWPAAQTVYVFNHTSSLDLFIVCVLGLPRVRFFMKRKFLLFVPMGILGLLAGTFFTAPQTEPQTRTRLFQRATRTLLRTGESVFLSPEGTRVTTGGIGPFNKGAFHLAAAMGAPIVPLYFATSTETNPGKGVLAGSGVVHVYVLPTVDTSSWEVANIGVHRDAMHALFKETHERLTSARA